MPVGPYLIAAGTGLRVFGGVRSSRAQRRQAALRENLAEINAGQRVAAGQQEAFEEERQARLVASRALALAAASGRAAGTGSAARTIADIEAEGAYRAALRVYESEEDARIIRLTGRLEAGALRDSASASRLGAVSDLVSGLPSLVRGSLYAKYGGGGPKGVDT